MSIQTQSADGVIHQFPDGTPDAVVDQAMKAYALSKAPPKPAAPPPSAGFGRALSDARAVAARDNAGGGGDLARSAFQGLTLGFGDEIDGALQGAFVGGRNLLAHTGLVSAAPYSASDAQNATVQAEREAQARFAQAHPIANTAVQIGAGLTTPGIGLAGRFVQGAGSVGGAIGRSALAGGLIGGISGAGNAEGGLINRAGGAAAGGAAGALLGAAIPAGVKTVQALVRRAPAAIAETGSSLTRMTGADPTPLNLTPEQQATARTQALTYVDDLRARSGKTLDDLDNHLIEAAGKPITAAEALGRSGTYQLTALGRRAGTTADSLEGALGTRALDAPDRVLGDFRDTLGVAPEAARGNVDALVEAGQAKAKPLFDAIHADTSPVVTPSLSAVARRPVIRQAARQAYADILNQGENPESYGIYKVGAPPSGTADAEVAGRLTSGDPRLTDGTGTDLAIRRPTEVGTSRSTTQVGPQGNYVSGDYTIPVDAEFELRAPTAKTWDLIRRAAGRQVERNPVTARALPDSQSPGNYGIGVATRDLTKALTANDAVPAMGEALKVSGDYLSMGDAFARAKGALFRSDLPVTDFQQMLARHTPAQIDATKASVANDLFRLQQNGRLRAALFRPPAVRAKLASLFGNEGAAKFIDRVQQEEQLSKGLRMMPGTGSITGEAVMGEDPAHGGEDLAHAVTSVLGGHRSLKSELLYRGARAFLAPARGASTPINQAARDEVGRLLQLPPSQLAEELRNVGIGHAPPRPVGRVLARGTVGLAGNAGGAAGSSNNRSLAGNP